jgi:hypothetical protein
MFLTHLFYEALTEKYMIIRNKSVFLTLNIKINIFIMLFFIFAFLLD